MNERSPLLKSTAINDGGVLPKFISDPRIKSKQHFKWAVPSQESEEAQKDRFFSIRLCYVSMFLSSVSFTISISSMWPYLLIIDKTTDTSFFGWIVSAYSIGQLISSPIFGYWSNKIRYHKLPIIVCMIIMAAGNIIYLYLESIGETKVFSPKIWMLIARFIMGFGAACAAVIRSYCSSATNLEERTATLSNISACQGIGFIIGPVLQAAFVPLGFPGPINRTAFHFNMYTSPALLSIIIYLSLAIIYLRYFNEYVVLDNATQNDVGKIVETIQSDSKTDSYTETLKNLPPPDYKAVVLTLILFFINCFVFSFYETLSSPLTIDMYAWSKTQATLYNGIILGVIGILSVIVVLVGKFLSKRIKEKKLMLAGYIILLFSVIALLPWGDDYPSVQIPTIQPGHRNTTTGMTTTSTATISHTTEESPRGCPLDYDWCLYTPIVKIWQFLLGFTLLVIGYSIANVMSFAIYSKILGPKPQGLWMGILTSFGSLSRAVGPVVVAYIYGSYGPRVSFIFLACVVFLAIIIIVATFKKYEAYKFS